MSKFVDYLKKEYDEDHMTEEEKEALGEIMGLNAMVARRKIALFEESQKPDPDESRLKYLKISSAFWEMEYDNIMGKKAKGK